MSLSDDGSEVWYTVTDGASTSRHVPLRHGSSPTTSPEWSPPVFANAVADPSPVGCAHCKGLEEVRPQPSSLNLAPNVPHSAWKCCSW